MTRERKELFCGILDACREWIANQPRPERLEMEINDRPGPPWSVYYRRKPADRTVKTPVRRLTRGTVRVQGVTRNPTRPLWVALEPGDVLSFTPQGTRQRVAVPMLSLYHHARFIAARAIANARRAERAAKRKGARAK